MKDESRQHVPSFAAPLQTRGQALTPLQSTSAVCVPLIPMDKGDRSEMKNAFSHPSSLIPSDESLPTNRRIPSDESLANLGWDL